MIARHARIITPGLGVLRLWVAGVAWSQQYLPLEIGNQWYYENDLDEHELMTIIGEETVLGEVTRVRRQDTGDDLFENFWSSGDDGSLYLHGARNLVAAIEWAFSPPIRWVSAPLYFGKAWVTRDVVMYNLDGTPMGGDPFDYPLRVDFEGSVDVPAGSYYAYGVGFDPDSLMTIRGPDGHLFDVFGRHCRDCRTDVDITDWYSIDVGLVMKTRRAFEQHPLQLIWWNPPTATTTTTWGRLKAGFGAHRREERR